MKRWVGLHFKWGGRLPKRVGRQRDLRAIEDVKRQLDELVPPVDRRSSCRTSIASDDASLSPTHEDLPKILPRSWKRDYLELQRAIGAFLAGPLAMPDNRVTTVLARKLEISVSLLGMEVNGYDGGMERELLAHVRRSDDEARMEVEALPETPDD